MTLILQSILNENYSYILVQTTIRQFIVSKVSDESQTQQQVLDKNESPVIIELPFIGQEICRCSTQTNCRPQSEDQCNYQPCVHKSKDQVRNQSNRRQATPLWVDNVLRITFSVTCVIQVNYVSYLHVPIDTFTSEIGHEEHKGTVIGNHLTDQHNMSPNDIARNFNFSKKEPYFWNA